MSTAIEVARPQAAGLAVPPASPDAFMPVLSVDAILQRHATLLQYKEQVLKPDVDYGIIPGTGNKPTLLKPGAEKLCTLFGLTVRFSIVERVEDWTGHAHGGEPFFYYLYRCSLLRGDLLIAEGDGSANSWESKHRYRKGERVCPHCGAASIIKGRPEYGGGFLCFAKKGGCGAKFDDSDPSIVGQEVGRVPNPDSADLVNTLQKMGQKRALVAATLVGVNGSDFFTQDIEDFAHGGMDLTSPAQIPNDAPPPPQPRQSQNAPQPSPPAPRAYELADDDLLSRAENMRQAAVGLGYLTERGTAPRPVQQGDSRRDVEAKLARWAGFVDQATSQPAGPANDEAIEGEVTEEPLVLNVPKNAEKGKCQKCQAEVFYIRNKGGHLVANMDHTQHFCQRPVQPAATGTTAGNARPKHLAALWAVANEYGLDCSPATRTARLATVNIALMDHGSQGVTSFNDLTADEAWLIQDLIKKGAIRAWGQPLQYGRAA